MKTLDSNYKSQLENSLMKNRLLKKENICILEELLNRDSQKLEKLQKIEKNGKLNFGDKVSSEELKELFPKICSEVNSFLNVQDIKIPRFGYYNLFSQKMSPSSPLGFYSVSAINFASFASSLFAGDPSPENILFGGLTLAIAIYVHGVSKNSNYSSDRVNLERVPRTELIPVAAHEYTHHIQKEKGLSTIISKKPTIFKEGHARGIERQISENYAQREDNEAFTYDLLNENVGEFKSAYIWMCEKLSYKPIKSLLKTKTNRDDDESTNHLIFSEPTSHAIGNALFSIYEASQGKEIYNQMIHGDFKFT